MARAVLGLGSNIGDPIENIRRALRALRHQVGPVSTVSNAYRSDPLGFKNQPDFINAVAIVETTLPPAELLKKLQQIEEGLGRRRTFRWGPRVIDLDILFYDGEEVNTPDLVIPHPEIAARLFVLAPLAEIAPEWPIPGGGTAVEAAAALAGTQTCECVGPLTAEGQEQTAD